MPSSTSLLSSTMKNKKNSNLKDSPSTPAKVLYEKDAPIYNPKESFYNISFDIVAGNKLIDVAYKVL